MLNARSVNAISTTGIYMNDKLFPALGIAGEMSKTVNSLGIADVPKSDTDLILRPVSEIVALPGFNYVGPIPDELQYISVFAAAIVTGSKHVEDARRLIVFLSSAQAQQAARKFHMQPVARGGR